MEISFSYDYVDTRIFEQEYEEELQEDQDIRENIIRNGLVVNMFLDEVLIGESFGTTPYDYALVLEQGYGLYDDDYAIADVDMSDDESVYVWSTTILPQWRGMGYGKKLRKEFSRHASEKGYAKLVGHATSPTMRSIMNNQGAIFRETAVHPKWFGTERTAHFYTQFLTQTNDYNCGPFALAYLLETKGHTFSIDYLEKRLHTTNELGTSPTEIEAFLAAEDILYKRIKGLAPMSLIDITVDNDGHWVTLLEKWGDVWRVYDPDKGLCCMGHKELLKSWHSPRYGPHQGFTLL